MTEVQAITDAEFSRSIKIGNWLTHFWDNGTGPSVRPKISFRISLMVRLLAVLTSTTLLWRSPQAFAATADSTSPVCGTLADTGETQSPDVKAVVRLATDWIETIHTADDASYVRFVQERGPVLRDGPERWLELRDNLRGLQLCGVKAVDADGVLLWGFEPKFDSHTVARFTRQVEWPG